jgi:phasin
MRGRDGGQSYYPMESTMKKPANDMFQFAQFDFSKMNESYREFAEKALAQSTEAYDKYKATAEEVTANAQKSFDALREGVTALSTKAIENTKANTEAGVAFVEKLAGAKSFAEVIELQGEFFRSAFDTLASQAKETQEMALKIGEKTAAPAKETVEKVSKVAA